MMSQLYTLTTGWRGYLVGPRRVWHPYHYFALAGYRSGWVVARPAAQTGQLARAAGLLESVFTRGGRAWGFGIGFHQGNTLWGRVWPEWLPGQITNCVYYRARQGFILREARSGLTVDRPDHRPERFTRVNRRGVTLWGAARPGWVVRHVVEFTEVDDSPLWGRLHPGWSTTVKARFLRLATQPALRWVARRDHRGGSSVGGRAVCSRTVTRTTVVALGKLADRRVRAVHLGRPRRRRPQADRPFRPARQYQTQPFGFPTVVVAAGTGTNRGLLSEAANLGVPAVYFAPAGFSPGLTPFGVVWGTHRRQPWGVSNVVALVYRHVWTTMLVQTVWSRLR